MRQRAERVRDPQLGRCSRVRGCRHSRYWILRVAPQKPRAPEAQQGICLEMSIKIYEKAFFKGPSGVCKGFKEGLDNHYSEE